MHVRKWTHLARRVIPCQSCGAVIVAAGSARRMAGVDKIMADLGGEPLLVRTVRAFQKVMAACGEDERVAFVVHGGTIMCLLEALEPSHRFYDWQAPNGGGYACGWDGERLTVTATI